MLTPIFYLQVLVFIKFLFVSSSMATLSEMFELEIPMVHSIISKMIINEELMVSVTASVLNQNRCI